MDFLLLLVTATDESIRLKDNFGRERPKRMRDEE